MHQPADLVDHQRQHVRQRGQAHVLKGRPPPASGLQAGDRHGPDTGRGHEAEEQDAESGQGCIVVLEVLSEGDRRVTRPNRVDHGQLRNKDLLGRSRSDQGRADPPVEAQGPDCRLYPAAETPDRGILQLPLPDLGLAEAGQGLGRWSGKAGQGPEQDRDPQDDRACLLEVLRAPLSGMDQDGLRRLKAASEAP